MSKIILDDDSTNLNPLRINENFRKIEEEFNEKVLYRKNPEGEPNEMENHLDMNGYRIFNLPKPTESHEPLRLLDIDLIPEDLQEYVEESKEWAEKSKDYYENTLEALSEGEVYIGDYGPDLTINNYTEFFGKNGIWYRPSPELELPYTTTGDWDSEATLFVSVGDQELRQELISQGIKNGASIVGYRNTTISEYLDNSFLSIKYAKGLGPDEDATKVLQDAVNKWDGNASLTVKIVGELRVDGVVIIPNKETLNPERRITISGGTLIKKNPGWIFTRPTDQELPDSTPLQTGHLTFDGVRFLGPRDESGTYIIDGDNIIRTKFVNCFGDGIQIAYAENYLQSVYIDISSVFRKWSGWLLDCGHLYDVRFYGTAEAGESFLRTRLKTADPAANSMTIRGCIEGLSGKVFEVGPCFGVVIDGNYQEQNAGGDYDFSVGDGYHKGLTLIGNGFQPSASQLADPNYYPVKLGKGAQDSITLIGNSSTGNLFDVDPGNQSAIVDLGNWCGSGKKKFSSTSPRLFSFSGVEMTARLLNGYGVNLNAYYGSFGFEAYRDSINGESVTPSVVMGPINPQSSPDSYPQKNWVKGTVVMNSAPVIDSRQYGSGTVRNALIYGWQCVASGTPGLWQEIAIMLPY